MWDLGNRGAVVLISVTFGCVLIYNAWGTILALALTLLFVVYACHSLLVNDSLLSPQAYHIFSYLREAVHELGTALSVAYVHGAGYVRKLRRIANNCYRERFPFRMDRRRASNYRLSSDSYASNAAAKRGSSSLSSLSSSSSKFNLIDQLSPIPRLPYRSHVNNVHAMEDRYHAGDHDRLLQRQQQQQLVFGKHTSTPVFSKEEDISNGDVDPAASQPRRIFSKKISPMSAQNYTLDRGENMTQFSPEGSPWGMSISPKMRPRPAGIKTVQTVAGPLLASTRYNIDPKVYTDVLSPGFTTRLTKYATEAKSKLTHQPQYSAWQFPKVNLYANPVPLLSTKSTKMRMPVTVRVAPPDMVQYSPPERQKILSNICHMENNSPTSVVQVLKEISLKRHASTEDVSFDIAKKQKTDFFIEEREPILEENKQKRSRDDSSKSDEDLSPQNKSARPAKRTKTRSCFDILNSLSSSINVATGVKRKAVEISRSETPNFEKHFKSLETAKSSNSTPILHPEHLDIDHGIPKFKEMYLRNFDNSKKSGEFPLMKGILKTSNKESKISLNEAAPVNDKMIKSTTEVNTKSVIPTKSVTLMEKLFMRAEPERNEQLKVLMNEPGNIRANFAMNDVEEIKREDIRNMRQTSMKARLRSMFDAISGKAENKINPDVVIQADDMNIVTPPATCSISCATLSSTTTTTNVNSTPLSTAVIVPSSFSSSRPNMKTDTKPAAVFNSTSTASPTQLSVPTTSAVKIKDMDLTVKTVGTIHQAEAVSIAPAITSASSLQEIVSLTPNTAPTFSFGKSTMETPAATSIISSPSFSLGTPITSSFTSVIVKTPISSSASTNLLTIVKTPISSTSTNLSTIVKPPSSSAFVPINSSITPVAKVETSNVVTASAIINSSTAANVQTNPIFTFSSNKPSAPIQTSISSLSSSPIITGTTLLPINTISTTSIAGFNSIASFTTSTTSSGTPSFVTTTSTIAPLFAFGNNSTASQVPKTDGFAFGQFNNNVQSKTNAFESPSRTQAIPLPPPPIMTKSFNFMSNTSVTTVGTISFTPNMTSTTTSAFGLSSAPTFTLGASTTPSTSALSISKPMFVFGTSSPNTTSTTIIPPATISGNTANFGTMNNNAVPIFKAPITTAISQFGAPTITISQFGAITTSIFAPTSNVTTNTNIFGTTNNNQSLFGNASTTPGTSSIFNSPTTTASSIFASITTAPSIFTPTTNIVSSSNSTTSSSLFSNVNANLTTTAAPSVFGSGTPIFGQAKPSTSFGASSNMFGNTTTPLFGSTTQSGTTVPTFGVTGNVSTSTITPSFDTTNITTSAFGAPSIRTVTNTQTTIPAFAGTTGMFGSTDNNTTSVPIFGANVTSATGAFGGSSTTSNFGTQNPPNFAFGAASGGTTFGDNKSPFGATPTITTSFGTSASSTSAFGAGNANNASNNTNNMFVFGSNQKEGQQTTTFSFGSNFNAGSNNTTTVSSVPFQFGSTSFKPATTGFNFSASSATPPATLNFGTTTAPTFNPSTPGMFSIGSGSTAPRSRTIRTRKPR